MSKILLVEDDKTLSKLMIYLLEKVNFEIITACNGLEAVEKAETTRPDIILMDVRLPLLDGWAATKKIKSLPNIAHIPIIALTAQASTLDRQRSLAAGCDDYMAKPVQFPALLQQIERLLAKASQGA